MSLKIVSDEVDRRMDELRRLKTENDLLERQVAENEQEMLEVGGVVVLSQKALKLLEDVSASRRSKMKTHIESVLTNAVQAIYNRRYRVELEYDVKRNRSSLEVVLIKMVKGQEVRMRTNFGGGVYDTLSVPLRLLVLLGSNTDKVCVVDEAWKHMDSQRVPLVAGFLHKVCDDLGVQILMLSHHVMMQAEADKVFKIRDDGEKAVVS